MNKTTEALKLAEEAAEFARNMCLGMNWSTDLPDEALAAIREVLAESKPAPDGRIPKTVFMLDDISKAAEMGRQAGMIDALAEPVKQKPVAWHDKIKGMEVSVDVSTGEDDAHHRVFGRVDSVMLESCGAQEDIILVIEESRNYAAPVSAKREWVELTDDELKAALEVHQVGLSVRIGRIAIAAFKDKNK